MEAAAPPRASSCSRSRSGSRPAGDLARSVLGQVGVDNEGLSGLELQYDDLLDRRARASSSSSRTPSGRTIPAGERQLEPAVRGDDLVLTIDRAHAVRDRAGPRRADPGQARQGRHGHRHPARHRRDPRPGQPRGRPGDRRRSSADRQQRAPSPPCSSPARSTRSSPWPPPSRRAWCRRRPSSSCPTSSRWATTTSPTTTRTRPRPTPSPRSSRESSNIGTIMLAQQLGKDRLDSYLRRFGFGTQDRARLARTRRRASCCRSTSTTPRRSGSIPIGQGIAVTAMQMLAAYNVLANDGVYVPPKLVLETVDADGDAPPHRRRRVAPGRVASDGRAAAGHARQRGGARARAPEAAITGYTRGRQDGHRPQAACNGGYEDARGQLPLRRRPSPASCPPSARSCRSSW